MGWDRRRLTGQVRTRETSTPVLVTRSLGRRWGLGKTSNGDPGSIRGVSRGLTLWQDVMYLRQVGAGRGAGDARLARDSIRRAGGYSVVGSTAVKSMTNKCPGVSVSSMDARGRTDPVSSQGRKRGPIRPYHDESPQSQGDRRWTQLPERMGPTDGRRPHAAGRRQRHRARGGCREAEEGRGRASSGSTITLGPKPKTAGTCATSRSPRAHDWGVEGSCHTVILPDGRTAYEMIRSEQGDDRERE